MRAFFISYGLKKCKSSEIMAFLKERGVHEMVKLPLRSLILTSFLTLLTLFAFIVVTFSWYTIRLEQTVQQDYDMGLIDVELDIYFVDNLGVETQKAQQVLVNDTVEMPGVYLVNVSSFNAVDYIENLRVDIINNSTIPTYIRVKVHRQLTLTYTLSGGEVTELSIFMNDDNLERNQLFYNDSWFIDSNVKGYYYDVSGNILDTTETIVYTKTGDSAYTDGSTNYILLTNGDLVIANTDSHGLYDIVIRNTHIFETLTEAQDYESLYYEYIYLENQLLPTTTTLNFIDDYLSDYNEYPTGYTLHIAFEVEAVQILGGPENLWGLTNPPWNNSLDW
jgi:hypothetical protein